MRAPSDDERARVLVVDDDPTVRRAVRLVLDSEFETVETGCGIEALRLVRAGRFATVLLDVLLPDVDGLEVLRRLRQADTAPPVVVVTGVTVLRTAVEAMKLGAVDYVSKPFGVEDLLVAVRRAIGGARPGAGVGAIPAPVAVVGGDAPTRVSLALLLEGIAPVERFPLGAAVLRTRELACAVVLAGSGSEQDAVAAALDGLAGRTSVFLATDAAARPPAGWRVEARRVVPLGDWRTLVTTVRRYLAPGGVGLGSHVAQAVRYMAAHHDRALTVGDVADAVNVSESHLAHRFPVETGHTVRGFLRALRLELAREQIAAGADKLDTIARRLVFADGPHLSRALRRAPARRGTPPWARPGARHA